MKGALCAKWPPPVDKLALGQWKKGDSGKGGGGVAKKAQGDCHSDD